MATRIKSITLEEKLGVSLFVTDCASCGVIFAMTTEFEKRRRNDHKTWYCPNGHHLVFSEENEEERLARELKVAQDSVAYWRRVHSDDVKELGSEKRSHAATKGQLTKVKKRIGNGVCPECNRHFTNVERHMASMHQGHEAALKEAERAKAEKAVS